MVENKKEKRKSETKHRQKPTAIQFSNQLELICERDGHFLFNLSHVTAKRKKKHCTSTKCKRNVRENQSTIGKIISCGHIQFIHKQAHIDITDN